VSPARACPLSNTRSRTTSARSATRSFQTASRFEDRTAASNVATILAVGITPGSRERDIWKAYHRRNPTPPLTVTWGGGAAGLEWILRDSGIKLTFFLNRVLFVEFAEDVAELSVDAEEDQQTDTLTGQKSNLEHQKPNSRF